MKKLILVVSIALVGSIATAAQSKQKYIGTKRAKEIASQQVAGKIKGSEREKEHGKMIYSIDILGTGRLDERESAFPQAVQLPDGDVVCSFSVGGGQYVHGGTDWARSTDGGKTWRVEGQLLPPTDDPPSANFLKLSSSNSTSDEYCVRSISAGTPAG